MFILVATDRRIPGVRRVRSALVLLPPFFFLLAFAVLSDFRAANIAELEAEANLISAEINGLSSNISDLLQTADLEDDGVQERLELASARMSKLRGDLDDAWLRMDKEKTRQAHEVFAANMLRLTGLILGGLGFLLVGHWHRELAPSCLVALAVLIGLGAVAP